MYDPYENINSNWSGNKWPQGYPPQTVQTNNIINTDKPWPPGYLFNGIQMINTQTNLSDPVQMKISDKPWPPGYSPSTYIGTNPPIITNNYNQPPNYNNGTNSNPPVTTSNHNQLSNYSNPVLPMNYNQPPNYNQINSNP